MNYRIFARLLTGTVAAAAFLPLTAVGPALTREVQTSLGFTFTHTKVDCPPGTSFPGGPMTPSVDSANNILQHYDEPATRAAVDNVLKTMRKSSDALRLIVWIAVGNATFAKTHTDHMGLLSSQNGEVSPRIAANLSAVLHEAQSLGYTKSYVVFGNEGRSSPQCRSKEFGDCYDSKDLEASWSIRKQLIDASRGSAQMPVYYDVSPESCPGAAASPLMTHNINEFTTYMVQQYAKTYSDDHFFVSCLGSPAKRAIAGLDGLSDLYRSLGVRPHTLDVHTYVADEAEAETVLGHASQDARALGVPLTVLETSYDDQPVFAAIAKLRRRGELGALETVAIWPKTLTAACAFSIQWPADLGGVAQSLGQ